jgi:hypothetical protein
VTLDVFVTTFKTVLGASNLKPDSFKFSLTVADFQYSYTNSKLALVASVWSSSSRSLDASNKKVTVGGSGSIFSWDGSVTADGQTASVAAENVFYSYDSEDGSNDDDDSSNGSESKQVIVFTVNAVQPSKVYWDPEVTLSSDSLSTTSAAIPQSSRLFDHHCYHRIIHLDVLNSNMNLRYKHKTNTSYI